MPVPRVTLRVIAVISHTTAFVSQAVSFHTQPAELELTTCHPSLAGYAWVANSRLGTGTVTGPGPAVVSSFADYKSAACHYARSPACNKTNRGLHTVTVVSRPCDRDAGGGGAIGAWPSPKGTCYIII